MKKTKVRIGLIGCGGCMMWAHVPEILKDKNADITAVSDPQQSQIEKLLEKAGLSRPGYADYKEMIRCEKLDAVFVSTPHSQHYEQMKFALDHGLHVLVQKPFTIRSDHAEKLVALAQKKSLFIMVSYQRFYHEQSIYARELVAKGAIGEVKAVACHITQNVLGVTGWRTDPVLAGGGFLMDTGSHLVSIMLRITGLKPVEVSAVTENYGRRVDVSSVVTIRFNNGAMGSLAFFGCTDRHDEIISIHGSKGSIQLSGHQWKPGPLLLNGEVTPIPARIKSGSPDAAFLRWIRTGGKGYEPPRTAIDTIKLTEAVYRAASAGKAVRVRM